MTLIVISSRLVLPNLRMRVGEEHCQAYGESATQSVPYRSNPSYKSHAVRAFPSVIKPPPLDGLQSLVTIVPESPGGKDLSLSGRR